jgi:HTH-type transcriptional regulator/antitoxin HigA
VLARKRALTVDMIRRLDREWHIPAGCLVAPYGLAA